MEILILILMTAFLGSIICYIVREINITKYEMYIKDMDCGELRNIVYTESNKRKSRVARKVLLEKRSWLNNLNR